MSTNGISFGNGKNIDFKGFNGIKKSDIEGDEKTQKLIKAYFDNYAKDKDVLDQKAMDAMKNDLLRAAKGGKASSLGEKEADKYLQSLGFKSGELTREDLYKFLSQINADKDNIIKAETDKEGNTTVTYKSDDPNISKQEVFSTDNKLKKGIVKSTNNGKETTTETIYQPDGTTRQQEVTKEKDLATGKTSAPITTVYENDGKTVKERFRRNGTVTEYLDDQNRVTSRLTDKGSGLIEKNEYEYLDNGKVRTTTYEKQDKDFVKKSMKEELAGQTTLEETYSTDENGNTVTLRKEGQNETKIVTGKDNKVMSVDGEEVQDEQSVEQNSSKPYTFKDNETWYDIAQAKYGTTDHKTTMEIVHKLKDEAGINHNSKERPDSINLPEKITLSNGKEVNLNMEGQVEEARKKASKSATQRLPGKDPIKTTIELPAVEVTKKRTIDKQNDILKAKYPNDIAKSAQELGLQQLNGSYFKRGTKLPQKGNNNTPAGIQRDTFYDWNPQAGAFIKRGASKEVIDKAVAENKSNYETQKLQQSKQKAQTDAVNIANAFNRPNRKYNFDPSARAINQLNKDNVLEFMKAYKEAKGRSIIFELTIRGQAVGSKELGDSAALNLLKSLAQTAQGKNLKWNNQITLQSVIADIEKNGFTSGNSHNAQLILNKL